MAETNTMTTFEAAATSTATAAAANLAGAAADTKDDFDDDNFDFVDTVFSEQITLQNSQLKKRSRTEKRKNTTEIQTETKSSVSVTKATIGKALDLSFATFNTVGNSSSDVAVDATSSTNPSEEGQDVASRYSGILQQQIRRKRRRTTQPQHKKLEDYWDDSQFCFASSPTHQSKKIILKNEEDRKNEEIERTIGCNRMKSIRSLPVLLAQRECGVWPREVVQHWQRKMIFSAPVKNSSLNSKKINKSKIISGDLNITAGSFAPYCRRQIPFTSLQTPVTEAVLGMDSTGTYLVCLGSSSNDDGDEEDENQDMNTNNGRNTQMPRSPEIPDLYLRFYGIPCRSMLEDRKSSRLFPEKRKGGVKPLMTVPLAFKEQGLSRGSLFNLFWLPPLLARFPIYFSFSSDWSIGLALWKPQTGRRSVVLPKMHAVLFPLPSSRTLFNASKQATIWSLHLDFGNCDNDVPVEQAHHFNSILKRKTILWRVDVLPGKCRTASESSNNEQWLCKDLIQAPGYLVVLPCSRLQIRFTWIQISGGTTPMVANDSRRRQGVSNHAQNGIIPSLSFIEVIPKQWTSVESEAIGGTRFDDKSRPSNSGSLLFSDRLDIICEAILHPKLFLSEICRQWPSFHAPETKQVLVVPPLCRLITLCSNGRSAEILLMFHAGRSLATVAAFFEIDLFTSTYRLLKARKKNNKDVESSVSWDVECDKLVLDHQMRNRGVGPYSINPALHGNWSDLCSSGQTTEPEELNDFDPDSWRWVNKRGENGPDCQGISSGTPLEASEMKQPPTTKVSMESVYPDSQVMDNLALVNGRPPARSLRCRSAPVEILYG